MTLPERRSIFTDVPARWGLAAAVAMAALCSAPAARAQDAAYVAPRDGGAAPWRVEAREALEAEGVVPAPDADACSDVPCATEVAKKLGLRSAVLLARTEREGVTAIELTLVTVAGSRASARAVVGTDGVGSAVREAYRAAEVALALGPQGLLRLASTPQGAIVRIDGKAVGASPLERKLDPGTHEVTLALDGFASQRRTLAIQAGRTSEIAVLLPRIEDARQGGAARERSSWNEVLGVALVASAVPALAISIRALALDGHCAKRDASSTCLERTQFGAGGGVLLGAGAVALIAGVYVLAAGPIRMQARVTPSSMLLQGSARF